MISVDVTLSDNLLNELRAQLASFAGKNGGEIAPATSAAVSTAAKIIQDTWRGWANGASIEGADVIKKANSRLAASINVKMNGSLDAEIGTDSPYMKRIQQGSPEYDMKKTYPYGRKSRVSKRGRPYLIIPFTWHTPNAEGGARAHGSLANTIPENLLAVVRSMRRSYTTGETHIEPNARGEGIARAEYSWGDRLSAEGNINGLVVFNNKKHTAFSTFRVISVDSPKNSWIRKEIPANDVAAAVERATRPAVEAVIEEGLKADFGVG